MAKRGSLLAFICACLVTGAAVAQPAPAILVTPDPLNFGTVCVGKSVTKTMTVKNNEPENGEGQQTLQVDDITKSGSGSNAFTILSDRSFTLQPQDSRTVDIRFNAALPPGGRAPRFTVEYQASETESIGGVAKVVHRLIGVDNSTVAFGEQRVGTRSPSKTLTIRNPGQDAIQVSSLQRTGANRTDFVVTAPAVPFTIAAGDFRTVTIAFQPTGEGLRRGTLEITSNSCTQPKLNVTLVGSGVVPNVAVQPNPIDVGSSPVGKAGKPVAITVSNEGAAELKVTAVQIIGADAADFVLTGLPPVPKTLQPGESFVFNIRMKATAEGLRLATVNVLSDDPDGGTFAVAVRGTATPAVSPSPTASATASTTPTATASASDEPVPTVKPNDSLAIVLVVGGVLSAFVGLMLVRKFIRTPDDADF